MNARRIPARKAAGFTPVIEVILATVLLASGPRSPFASLRAASATATRGEEVAHRDERMRAVSNFLRGRLSSARSIAYALDSSTGQQLRFTGDGGQMRFVADLPDYLGRGGPYVHTLRVVRDDDGSQRIEVDLAMALGGQTIAESPLRPPDVLADGLGDVRFPLPRHDRGRTAARRLERHLGHARCVALQVSIDLADKGRARVAFAGGVAAAGRRRGQRAGPQDAL